MTTDETCALIVVAAEVASSTRAWVVGVTAGAVLVALEAGALLGAAAGLVLTGPGELQAASVRTVDAITATSAVVDLFMLFPFDDGDMPSMVCASNGQHRANVKACKPWRSGVQIPQLGSRNRAGLRGVSRGIGGSSTGDL